MKLLAAALALGGVVTTAACVQETQRSVDAGIGPDPVLPEPESSLLPTVNIAEAIGWPPGERPSAAPGIEVSAFATGLDHPRWLYVLPNGDVLVAETNAPAGRDNREGIRGWFMGRVMAKAGAAVPSADRISLLRDADGDGVAETRTTFLENLHSPFGMVLVDDTFYVANTDAIMAFEYETGQTEISSPGTKLADLPAGARNHHWTKSLLASADGSKLYVGVGSNSNVAEHGMEVEEGRAAIWEFDRDTGQGRIFASGLRNPVGLTWVAETNTLWTAVNERDDLGDDLVPDYMTSVREGGFYGWPYSYFGQHLDQRVKPQRPELVAQAIKPDYALGAHTASLGLVYTGTTALPEPFSNGMFVGQHGSWNRESRSGYKVIFVPFSGGMPSGQPMDVLTDFVVEDKARGRPVGVVLDREGALLVADDVGNVVWHLRGASPPQTRNPGN